MIVIIGLTPTEVGNRRGVGDVEARRRRAPRRRGRRRPPRGRAAIRAVPIGWNASRRSWAGFERDRLEGRRCRRGGAPRPGRCSDRPRSPRPRSGPRRRGRCRRRAAGVLVGRAGRWPAAMPSPASPTRPARAVGEMDPDRADVGEPEHRLLVLAAGAEQPGAAERKRREGRLEQDAAAAPTRRCSSSASRPPSRAPPPRSGRRPSRRGGCGGCVRPRRRRAPSAAAAPACRGRRRRRSPASARTA